MVALGKKIRYYILAIGILGMYLLINIKSEPPMTPAEPPLVRTKIIDLIQGTPYFTYPGDVRGRYESQLALLFICLPSNKFVMLTRFLFSMKGK